MCQIMEELCDEAEVRGIAKGLTKGKARTGVRMIKNLMESMDIPMEKAMDILKVSAKDRKAYAGLVLKKRKRLAK